MMKYLPLKAAVAATLIVTPFAAHADHHAAATDAAAAPASETIVAKAASVPNFSTLVTAVKAAGLAETLNGPGPFTVFAPTNEAFAALPEGTVASLVEPANRETLTRILTYHVVPGRILAADVAKAVADGSGSATLTTIANETLTARYDDQGQLVLVDKTGAVARIIMTDVIQSNGVIHAIDKVVMPG